MVLLSCEPGIGHDASAALVADLETAASIIFDWDDTLLPTSFLTEAMEMCMPSGGLGRHKGMSSRRLPANFPCFGALQKHEDTVRRTLTNARAVARVAIVTAASRPWVVESADTFLPGLNLASLLQDLGIPVYYANEYSQPVRDTNIESWVACKRNAMLEFLQEGCAYGKEFVNVLSIGDSAVEKNAAKAALQRGPDGLGSAGACTLCKTVKLMEDPSLKQLGEQLQLLEPQLDRLVAHCTDLEITATKPEDLAAQLRMLRTATATGCCQRSAPPCDAGLLVATGTPPHTASTRSARAVSRRR